MFTCSKFSQKCLATLKLHRPLIRNEQKFSSVGSRLMKDEATRKEESGEQTENPEVQKEIEKLKEQLDDFKDKYQRSLAETENVRFRMKKQVEDAKMFAVQSFCKDLLNVADIMKLAVNSISPETLDQLPSNMQVWKQMHEGVVMTNKELHNVFERHGLSMITPSIGDKFDPNKHEALFEVPSDQLEAGSIAYVEENHAGYQLKSRTIRAVKVGVAKKM